MTHSVSDPELSELLKAKRMFKEAWQIVDDVVYRRYLKLALETNTEVPERRNGDRRIEQAT